MSPTPDRRSCDSVVPDCPAICSSKGISRCRRVMTINDSGFVSGSTSTRSLFVVSSTILAGVFIRHEFKNSTRTCSSYYDIICIAEESAQNHRIGQSCMGFAAHLHLSMTQDVMRARCPLGCRRIYCDPPKFVLG